MSHADPRIIVKRDEDDLLNWLGTEEGFLSLVSFEGETVEWEGYQLGFLRSKGKYRWCNKSRQIGFTFVMAGEALARAHIRDGYTANFVSYNRDAAKEIITYVREFYESLPLSFQKKLVRESLTELVFESNSGKRTKQSRIISHPSKAPRGKRGDIYLDEFAHYAHDREVYKGATAVISRVKGAQLAACSTPLGARGLFWEIDQQKLRPYKKHLRQRVPWWLCVAFCHDIGTAVVEAPKMETAERVERFGTEAIKDQFDGLPLDDFQQEFETLYVDETVSYYPYSLLVPLQDSELVVAKDVDDLGYDKYAPVKLGTGRLTAGFDIGRRGDTSELTAVEWVKEKGVLRLSKTFDRVAYDDQEGYLRMMMNTLPIERLSIDSTGHGAHLAENLSADYEDVVEECVFTNKAKAVWAVNFKLLAQRKKLVIPADRVLLSQIHSVQRTVLPSGAVRYEGRGNASEGKHHADKFWALALAVRGDDQQDNHDHDVGVEMLVFR